MRERDFEGHHNFGVMRQCSLERVMRLVAGIAGQLQHAAQPGGDGHGAVPASLRGTRLQPGEFWFGFCETTEADERVETQVIQRVHAGGDEMRSAVDVDQRLDNPLIVALRMRQQRGTTRRHTVARLVAGQFCSLINNRD